MTRARAARLQSGGLLLATASALAIADFALALLLPSPRPTDDALVRAARVASSAGLLRLVSTFGIVRALGLAIAAVLLSSRAEGRWRGAGRLAWRLMLVAAALFLAVDLFNTFVLVPLAQHYATQRSSYEFAEGAEMKVVGMAALLFSGGALLVFVVEAAARHRAIGSGWIAFGIVSGAAGFLGAAGVIAGLPRLEHLFVVSYLAFVPLARLGVRLAAGIPKAGGEAAG